MNKVSNCLLFISLPAVAFSQQMTDYTGPVFPSDHALNMPINELPVHSNSANFVAGIGANTAFHPDFGTSWNDEGTLRQIGIPYNVVGEGQPMVPIAFVLYADESDPGPWPIPQNPYIETVFDWRDTDPGDRHMLIIDSSNHILYETGNVFGNANGTSWEGGCGALFDLQSNELRPATWTSADAAGLPVFPLLIRYDEVERALATGDEIPHAIRFTVASTQRAFIWPARHYASSSTDPNRPPMGLRFRLKADFDLSAFSPRMQVILRTFKKYGIIVADNGSNWYFQGTHDVRWDDDEINSLKNLHGRDFEAVDISPWINRPGFDPNSAAVPEGSTTGIYESPDHHITPNMMLFQNHPNPFSASTFISFVIPEREKICIKIYTALGAELATLLNEEKAAGYYTMQWNGCDAAGKRAGNGVYFCRIETGDRISNTIKMIQLE